VSTSTGSGWGGGSGSGTGSGTGGTKTRFFDALRRNMEQKGWQTVWVPGFAWAAVESAHYDIDTLFAAFDADATDMLEGAHAKLSHWADGHEPKMPETRIAIAVFDTATQGEVEFITKQLQAGNRMGIQSLTAVIDLRTGHTFEPQEGSGAGYERIRINQPVFEQLRTVVSVLAKAV
jgi:hypothetical protein